MQKKSRPLIKKKSDKIIRWMNAGIWPATVMLSVGFNYDEIIAHCNKVKADGWQKAIENDRNLIEGGNNFCLRRDMENVKTGKTVTFFYVILKNQFDFSDYSFCVLAHELYHLCQFMMKDFLDPEREWESVAYTHTYFMETILKELRK